MPDLSVQASHQFWFEFKDSMIYRVIVFMESVEHWTQDGDPGLEAAITRLGQELDDLGDVDLDKLGNKDVFVRIACNIKMGRVLRLLQSIDSAHPGSASKLLMHADESTESNADPAGIFLRRNIVFERLRLLSRVFSNERFQLVTKALEGED